MWTRYIQTPLKTFLWVQMATFKLGASVHKSVPLKWHNSLNCTTWKGSYTLRRTSTSSFEGGSLNGPGRVLLISLKHTRSNTIHKYICTCLHFAHRYIRLRLLQNWNWIVLRQASMSSYLYTSRMAQYKSCTPSSWFSLVLANRSQMRSIIFFTCGWHFSLAETTINAIWHQWASPFRLLYWLYSQNKQLNKMHLISIMFELDHDC